MRLTLLAGSLALLASAFVNAAVLESRQTTSCTSNSSSTLDKGWNYNVTVPYTSDRGVKITNRTSDFYVPSNTGGDKFSIVMALHNSRSKGGKSFVDYMNLTPLADRHNFIIIAPTGSVKYIPSIGGFTWNISYVPVQDSNLVDEAGTKYYRGQDRNYLSALLTQAQSYGCVEKTKTYLAGMSGGGRMASSIACAGGISQKIGAIATFSSLRAGPADPNADPAFSQVLTKDLTYADSSQNVYACAPSHGLGIFAVHGKADNTNPFDGKTTDGTYKKQWGYSIPSATKRWSDLFSCKAMPDKPVANSEAVNSTWSCPQLAATNAAINLYVIDKLGHNLPTKDQPGVGSFDYQEAMWSFFQNYRTA